MADDKNNPETPESGTPRPANDQPAADEATAAGAAAHGGGSADPADPSDPLDPAEARIAELEAELAALKDSSLRALAEAENIRKRAERQVADANRYGAVSLARDMLSISDNLRRALDAVTPDAAGGNEMLTNLRAGVEMTENELQQVLQRHGVKEITPTPGEKFDHNQHQAMLEMQTDEYPPGSVAQVMQAGYMLHDRLLRAAMVGVAKALADLAQDTPADDGADRNGTEGDGTEGKGA